MRCLRAAFTAGDTELLHRTTERLTVTLESTGNLKQGAELAMRDGSYSEDDRVEKESTSAIQSDPPFLRILWASAMKSAMLVPMRERQNITMCTEES